MAQQAFFSFAFLLLLSASSCLSESYIPKVVYGTPATVAVTEFDPEEDPIKHAPVYKIEFTVTTDDGGEDDAIVHRWDSTK